jgi:hypothetical protein
MKVVNGSNFWRPSLLHTAHTSEETTTAAEKLREEILGRDTAGTLIVETFLAILVINLSLLGVLEDFVSMRQILELFGCTRVVGVLVCSVVRIDATTKLDQLPGWCFNAPTLYAFLSSCSVQFGAT